MRIQTCAQRGIRRGALHGRRPRRLRMPIWVAANSNSFGACANARVVASSFAGSQFTAAQLERHGYRLGGWRVAAKRSIQRRVVCVSRHGALCLGWTWRALGA